MTKNQLLETFPLGNAFPVDADRRRYDPVTAIAGGVGLVGNVVGGFMGSSAAKKAGAIQAQAAQAASDKVGDSVNLANAPIADATKNAQELATAGGNRVIDTAGAAKAGMDTAARDANSLLNPYADAGADAAGTLKTGLAAGGDFNKMPTLADLQMDPGAAWQRQQMEQTLARSAAAKGGAVSGAALKDLTNYSAGALAQDYQNSFNRFETATQNRFSNLFNVSRAGQDASNVQGGNLTGAAKYGGDITTRGAETALGANEFAGQAGMTGANEIGTNFMNGARTQADLITGKGAAEAAGVVGSANAMAGGIAGGANAVTGSLNTYNLMKNPAVRGTPSGTPAGLPPGSVPIYTGGGGLMPPPPTVSGYPMRTR